MTANMERDVRLLNGHAPAISPLLEGLALSTVKAAVLARLPGPRNGVLLFARCAGPSLE